VWAQQEALGSRTGPCCCMAEQCQEKQRGPRKMDQKRTQVLGVEKDERLWLGRGSRREQWACWGWVMRLSDLLVLSHHFSIRAEIYFKKHLWRWKCMKKLMGPLRAFPGSLPHRLLPRDAGPSWGPCVCRVRPTPQGPGPALMRFQLALQTASSREQRALRGQERWGEHG